MGHNFDLPIMLPLEDIEIQKAPRVFGGKREGWWQFKYKGKVYKFFGSVINPPSPKELGYCEITHAKKLAAEAIVLNEAKIIN